MATDAVTDYREQAKLFLARAWEYLAQGDLHQASEKGWGAAAHMVKAVAEAQGVPYQTHDEFNLVIYDAFFKENRQFEGICELSDTPVLSGFLTTLTNIFV